MSNNPRDFREWMTQVERQGRQLRGIPSIITQAVEVIVDDIEKDKVRHPAAPIELTFQTALYTDTSSRIRVRFLMDFPDVVFNTDGTAAAIQQYELWAKEETPSALELLTSAVPGLALPGAALPSLTNTTTNAAITAQEKPWTLRDTNTASFFRTDGFIPGTVWRFKARAIGANTVTPGEWSEDLVVQMLADTNPPPQPTAPRLVIQRGTITASWDGMSVNGPMPADFKYAILAHGTSSSPTLEIARFGRAGGFKVVADIDYYDPQFFRIRAVDESGNLGPWSEQGVGYTTPLVDKDITLSTIDGAKTYLKNIDARISILDGTILTQHLVVTEEMTAAIANFLYVRADKIDVNSLAADTAFVGLMDAVLVRADMFEGKAFMGGTFTTAFGGKFQTDVEDLSGIKLTAAALTAWSDSGVETFHLDAATGDLTAVGEFRTALAGPRIRLFADDTSGTIEMFPDNTAQRARFWSGPSQGGFTTLIQNLNASNVLMSELSLNSSGGVEVLASTSRTLTLDTTSDYSEIVFGKTAPRFVGTVGRPQQLNGAFGLLAGPGLDIRIATVDPNKGMYATPVYQITSSASGNVVIDANGLLMRSTSASKYKLLQQEMALPKSLLDVKVKDWVDRAEAETYARALPEPSTWDEMSAEQRAEFEASGIQRFPGAIAEDVLAAGGAQFVVFGNEGTVEGLMYDRLALAQISLLKAEIDELRATLNEMQGVV